MGLFLHKKVKNSLSTSGVGSIFVGGPSKAGMYVDEGTALQTAAVYACVKVIAETIASLPLHVYRYDAMGAVPEPSHQLYRLLHTAPNPEMTSFTFRETLMKHLLLTGNAYAQILRDAGGRVRALYPLLPHKMDVNRHSNGELFYTYWRDFDETRPQEKSGGVALFRDDVLHIPGMSNDGLVGLSPIALARNAIGMAIATENFGAGFFANSSTPSGILESPNHIVDHDKVRAAWEILYKGDKQRVAVLEDGMKFHQVSVPPEQAQFLETRKFQLNEIARIFRIPPHMIGDLEKSTFSNIEQQSLEFVKYTIEPWVVRLEQAMDMALLSEAEQGKYYTKFNLDGLLRGDYETRTNGYSKGIQSGFMSPNDVRRLENWPLLPPEIGDVYMVNGTMMSLEDIRKRFSREGDASE